MKQIIYGDAEALNIKLFFYNMSNLYRVYWRGGKFFRM